MSELLTVTLVFGLWFAAYLFLQLNTKVFMRHYFMAFGAVFLTGLFAVGIGFLWLSSDTLTGIIVGVFSGLVALVLLAMAVVKLQVATETRFQKIGKLFRTLTWYEAVPIDFDLDPGANTISDMRPCRSIRDFNTVTEDGVSICGTLISAGHKRVIVIAHGSFRSKNTMAYVVLAQWLAYKFDVVTFDFRGHGESGGHFDFSDSTVNDIKSIVDYAKQLGYQKIGIFGRSMGAWSVLLEAAKFGNVDSIVAAASPLGQITAIPSAKRIKRFLDVPIIGMGLRFVVKWGLVVMRNTHLDGMKNASYCPIEIVHKISPIPVFFIYQEYDTVIKTQVRDAKEIFEASNERKKLLVLAGRGHIFETHQFHRVYQEIETWFEQTLSLGSG